MGEHGRTDKHETGNKLIMLNVLGCGAVATVVAMGGLGVGLRADAQFGSVKATNYVEKFGFKDATVESTNKFFPVVTGCGTSDAAQYNIHATTPNGSPAELVVCEGINGTSLRLN